MSDLFPSRFALNRREFLASLATTGALMSLPGGAGLYAAEAQAPQGQKGKDQLNVALVGYGAEGQVLLESCLRPGIPGIRFKAVVDIRFKERADYARKLLKRYGHEAKAYEDYKEMLTEAGKDKLDLDAVIIATPDWMHAEHANACLEAGLHVYCEKEMSNSLAKAKSMVECARRTGKLLQIGHQRRSNPRYKHAIETLIREHKMLGRLTKATAQWNRSPADFFVSPEKFVLPQETLTKFGYQNMKELLNWRWFKKYGGGPMVDLGSHQIDLFIWAFGCAPSSIMAAGGNDYYTERELYDNVTALYEFRTPEGIARANYNVFTTTQHGGFYENFMGTEGTIVISEVTARGNIAEKEPNTFENGKRWDIAIEKGWIKAPAMALKAATTKNVSVDTRHSAPAGVYPLAMELDKPAHAPHLENFFDAIRLGVPLNCPPELAYESAVAVLKANEAVAAGRRLDFTHDEFKA